MEYLKESDHFKTTDMSLVSTLIYLGYQITAIDDHNPSKVHFVIKRDGKTDEVIQSYWNKELSVEPLAFFNCIKEVKTRIRNT